MKTLFSLCLVGLIITPLLPLASAHGVCTGIPPRFGRLDDVHFSSQSVQTGDTVIITGNITMMVQQDLQGYLSIHSSPSPHARWIGVSTEPSEKMINVTQFSRVPFSMTIKALQPGTYKLSPILNLPEIGPAFSMLNGCNTEPVVTVTGKSVCNTGFVSVLKVEDGSSFCVKPDTANILRERGWAEPVTSGVSQTNRTNIKNNDPFGITALVIYHPFLGCLSSGCPHNNFYLKINSNSTAYLTGYSICEVESCAKNNNLSILLPINTILKNPNYASIELPESLKWKDGDTVTIQLKVSSSANDETGLLVDLGNSTIVP